MNKLRFYFHASFHFLRGTILNVLLPTTSYRNVQHPQQYSLNEFVPKTHYQRRYKSRKVHLFTRLNSRLIHPYGKTPASLQSGALGFRAAPGLAHVIYVRINLTIQCTNTELLCGILGFCWLDDDIYTKIALKFKRQHIMAHRPAAICCPIQLACINYCNQCYLRGPASDTEIS